MPNELTEEARADLDAKRARGKLALEFVESEFFKKHFKEFVKESSEKSLKRPRYIRNGSRTAQSIGEECIFLEGVNSAMASIQQTVTGWISEGEDALKKLEQDDRRKQ